MLDVRVSVAWKGEMDELRGVGGSMGGGKHCCPVVTLTD